MRSFLHALKRVVRAMVPEALLLQYHRAISWAAAAWYGFPSRRMIVVGITGTKGKTTTANMMHAVLTAGGIKAGIITTANIRISTEESMNTYHMTMPGRAAIHRTMARMVAAGCTHCVVEVTSEGLKQYRHTGIAFDTAVFTNLFPEHLPSHNNSFDDYKAMKRRLFATLATRPRKMVDGTTVSTTIVANADSEHAAYYLACDADSKVTYGIETAADVRATGVSTVDGHAAFDCGGQQYVLGVPGEFNAINALPAIVVGQRAGVSKDRIAAGLAGCTLIPGRMETIDAGQPYAVVVDYAHERQSMTLALTAARGMAAPGGRVTVLLGAEGGGRDPRKRPAMGEVAAQLADRVIVSNVDPYDDDPLVIIEDIAVAAEAAGKVRGTNLLTVPDRREGIRAALADAVAGDVVIITGKGAEQSMVVGGVKIPWDDRTVVREELTRLMTHVV